MRGRKWGAFGALGAAGAAAITTIILTTSGSTRIAAHLFLSPTGSDTCTRSSTLVTFTAATGHVCATFSKACSLTQAGDNVIVEPGTYPTPAVQRYITGDCSGGAGADVNPNAAEQGVSTGTTANWVTFSCDTGATARSVIFGLGNATFKGNEHTIFDGGPSQCFYFWSLYVGEAGDVSLTSQNMQFINVWAGGMKIAGAKNVLIEGGQMGPSVKCASNDTGMAPQYQCDPLGPWYEAPYATYNPNGHTAAQCTANVSQCGGDSELQNEPLIEGNSAASPASTNIRLQGVWIHDQQSKNSGTVGSGWHPGGLLVLTNSALLPDYSVVLDGVKVERVAVQGIQIGPGSGDNESGFAVENSIFGCPTYPLDDATNNPTKVWAKCALTAFEFKTAAATGTTLSNMVIRYNDFFDTGSAITFSALGTNTSVRVVGNVIGHNAPNCPTGVSFDHNTSEVGTPCSDANATSIASSPFAATDAGTAYSESSLITGALLGSPAVGTVSSLTGDLALSTDYNGSARSSGTSEGAVDH